MYNTINYYGVQKGNDYGKRGKMHNMYNALIKAEYDNTVCVMIVLCIL